MTQPPATESTVTVPVVGTVKRRWVFVGVAAVAAIVGYMYIRRARQPSAVYNTATGTPDAMPTDGYTNPVPNPPSSGVQVDDPTVNTNDAEWSKKVVQSLMDTGWDAQYVSIVVGKYLAGMPLTPEEVNVIRAGEALEGKAPSGIQIVAVPNPAPTTPPPSTPDPTPPNTPTAKRRYVIASHFQGPPYPWDSYLDGIRFRYGRSRENLQSWNGISNPNLIYAGQKIYVDPPGSYSGEQRVN